MTTLTEALARTEDKATLREILLDSLADAISHREVEYVFCRDCRDAATGVCCPDHEADQQAVREYEAAQSRLRRAGAGDIAFIAAALCGDGESPGALTDGEG